MKSRILFIFNFLLALPLSVLAAEPVGHQFTSRSDIEFSQSLKTAFDRSGELVSHRTHADGSVSADHNGSFANVTVARMGPGGRLETLCTTDEELARSWMAGEDFTRQASPLESNDGEE